MKPVTLPVNFLVQFWESTKRWIDCTIKSDDQNTGQDIGEIPEITIIHWNWIKGQQTLNTKAVRTQNSSVQQFPPPDPVRCHHD